MKTNEKIDKLIYSITLVIMVTIPILKFITYVPFISNIDPVFITKSRVYFMWLSVIPLMIIYLYSVVSEERKINYYDYILYFLIIMAVVSTIFSVDVKKSFLGENSRYEGLYSLLHYYFLALNIKNIRNEKYKENIIKCFIVIGIFQSLYAILQAYTPTTFWNRKFSGGSYMAMGLCSNPNFFGAYMAMQISIVTVYFIKTGKIKYLLIYILFCIGLYSANSSGPVLGYILSFILIGILLRKNYKKIVILVAVFLITCNTADAILKYLHQRVYNNYIVDNYVISNEIKETIEKIENNELESLGNGRINLWLTSLPLMKEYWLHGSGLDTFGDVYPQTGNVYYDKAHNVYLQIGITNGIFALVAYLLICLIVFLKGFKLKKTYSVALFMSFISYCILAFANISAIDVAPYFFIILGLLISDEKGINLIDKNNN